MMVEQELIRLTETLNKFIGAQENHNRTMLLEMETVKRGFYGDKTNLVKGLLERQDEDEKNIEVLFDRLKKVEDQRMKWKWQAIGFLAGVEVVLQIVKFIISINPNA